MSDIFRRIISVNAPLEFLQHLILFVIIEPVEKTNIIKTRLITNDVKEEAKNTTHKHLLLFVLFSDFL